MPRRYLWGIVLLAIALALSTVLAAVQSPASDHQDSPATTADPAADLADLYAWHQPVSNSLTAVFTFAGGQAPAASQQALFDPDVLYTLNIDNNEDDIADIAIYVRFGQNPDGDFGLQVQNLPGAEGTIEGAVESVVDGGNGTQVFAGLRDDPFFFDLEGFDETIASAELAFDDDRDSFAATNATAVVLRMGLSQALDGNDTLSLWLTSARI